MLIGNLPRKSAEGRYNLRHKSTVRHHGDHEIEARFIAPARRQGKTLVVWKVREKHGATTLPREKSRKTTRRMMQGAVS